MRPFQAEEHFRYDGRLGIAVPDLKRDWEDYSHGEQALILLYWEGVRGRIPNRIYEIEAQINELQRQSESEHNFELVCRLAWEIGDLASAIHDLQIYLRINADIATKAHH